MNIRKGDIVGRISYKKDIMFIVDRIIYTHNGNIAILKGLDIRIEADAPINDLETFSKKIVKSKFNSIQNDIINRLNSRNLEEKREAYTGKILHLDGDRRYSQKSARYYEKAGLRAIVKNVPENMQPNLVYGLLQRYKPDILIITGHDSMIKNGTNYSNIYNYRNSKYFINTVIEARKWEISSDKLVIFAGACQSFFEAIINSGADFAASPGRILIDFIDPLIVAEKIATTESNIFITGNEIAREIKEGSKGISGIGAKGKKKY